MLNGKFNDAMIWASESDFSERRQDGRKGGRGEALPQQSSLVR